MSGFPIGLVSLDPPGCASSFLPNVCLMPLVGGTEQTIIGVNPSHRIENLGQFVPPEDDNLWLTSQCGADPLLSPEVASANALPRHNAEIRRNSTRGGKAILP